MRADLDQRVASVELVNAAGELQRVYFAHPRFCLHLTQDTRKGLFDRIDPNDPTRQPSEMLKSVNPFRREMMHLEWLNGKPAFTRPVRAPYELVMFLHKAGIDFRAAASSAAWASRSPPTSGSTSTPHLPAGSATPAPSLAALSVVAAGGRSLQAALSCL